MFKHQNLISNILIQDQEKLKFDIDFFKSKLVKFKTFRNEFDTQNLN